MFDYGHITVKAPHPLLVVHHNALLQKIIYDLFIN